MNIRYNGLISIPKTGIYTFYFKSDDGSKSYIDNQLVIDKDGSHGSTTKREWWLVKKGFIPFVFIILKIFWEKFWNWIIRDPIQRIPAIFWHYCRVKPKLALNLMHLLWHFSLDLTLRIL